MKALEQATAGTTQQLASRRAASLSNLVEIDSFFLNRRCGGRQRRLPFFRRSSLPRLMGGSKRTATGESTSIILVFSSSGRQHYAPVFNPN